jgi:hypothetical protein
MGWERNGAGCGKPEGLFLVMEPSWILRPIPDLREKLEMRAKQGDRIS